MVQPGFFVLHPAVLPPLPAGTYTLHGQVEDVPTGPVAPLDSTITVSSPRWTMPPDQILFDVPAGQQRGRVPGDPAPDRAEAPHPAVGAHG